MARRRTLSPCAPLPLLYCKQPQQQPHCSWSFMGRGVGAAPLQLVIHGARRGSQMSQYTSNTPFLYRQGREPCPRQGREKSINAPCRWVLVREQGSGDRGEPRSGARAHRGRALLPAAESSDAGQPRPRSLPRRLGGPQCHLAGGR